jgi:hypothetical protein
VFVNAKTSIVERIVRSLPAWAVKSTIVTDDHVEHPTEVDKRPGTVFTAGLRVGSDEKPVDFHIRRASLTQNVSEVGALAAAGVFWSSSVLPMLAPILGAPIAPCMAISLSLALLGSITLCAAPMISTRRKYTYLADWMTTLFMRETSPEDLRMAGLVRIGAAASLNVPSEDYASLARDTVDLAVRSKELGFPLSPVGRPGWF